LGIRELGRKQFCRVQLRGRIIFLYQQDVHAASQLHHFLKHSGGVKLRAREHVTD
jgi:hypothetical protein